MKRIPAPSWRTLDPAPRTVGAVLLLCLLCVPRAVSAQEPRDSLAAEVARLSALVDSLAREVARLRAAGQPAAADSAQDALARFAPVRCEPVSQPTSCPAATACPASRRIVQSNRLISPIKPATKREAGRS